MIYLGHTPMGYRIHAIETDQTHPVNRTMQALCGERVKVTTTLHWSWSIDPRRCVDCVRRVR